MANLPIPISSVQDNPEISELTAQIVSAHVSFNPVAAEELPALIRSVYTSLSNARGNAAREPEQEPAVPIKQSVRSDQVICLECALSFSMIRRHLQASHNLTVDQYRKKWKLSPAYPMVAPDYAKVRSTLAKQIGLGRPTGTRKASKR